MPTTKPRSKYPRIHRLFKIGGVEVNLTRVEAELFTTLEVNQGRLVSGKNLTLKEWGEYDESANQLLRVHLANIRTKVRKAGGNPNCIPCVRDQGYCYQP